ESAYTKAISDFESEESAQPLVGYTYDVADHLTQIAQGSSAAGFTYDNAGRRTSLTLPNGVTVNYSFDVGSQLTGLTYTLGTNTLGNLTYTYDADSRRVATGGSKPRRRKRKSKRG